MMYDRCYNLCDEKDHKEYKLTYGDGGVSNISSYLEIYDFFFVQSYKPYNYPINSRLDGPALKLKDVNYSEFYINGFAFFEENYWKNPAVVTYQYLKKYPELESFV